MLKPTGRTTVRVLPDEEYVFDEIALELDDLFRIKAATGLNLKPLMRGVDDGDPAALQALVWFCRLQAGKAMDIAHVNFRLSDLRIEPILEEEAAPDPTGEATTSEPAATDTSASSPTTAT